MTDLLFRDAYARACETEVVAVTPQGGIVPAASVFYPTGGGQPGDRGMLNWDGGTAEVVTTVKALDGLALVLAEGADAPTVGTKVKMELDWATRHRFMRVHTALHLLSVVIPLPVTGGSIGADKGRLDFNMPDALEDKDALERELLEFIARDLPVTEDWITDAALAANPGLVKTMSVKPPTGQGRVRLIRIGAGEAEVDLQPCGGTHVARTGEIGQVRLGKVEKKGRQNRRVSLHLI